jgi:hypothetical protein
LVGPQAGVAAQAGGRPATPIDRPRFCASCTEPRDDLVAELLDGRRVHLCSDCASGELRGGRWSFAGGRDANGALRDNSDGNRRVRSGIG